MIKLFRKISVFILSFSVLFSGSTSFAVDFSPLDSETAIAGTSVSLKRFLETEEDAGEKIMAFLTAISDAKDPTKGEPEFISYEQTEYGVVNVDSYLNLREEPSVEANVLSWLLRGSSVSVYGEITVDEMKWLRIIEENGLSGYVSAEYIAFGETAEAIRTAVKAEAEKKKRLPEDFVLGEDISWLDAPTLSVMQNQSAELHNCLVQYYPNAEKEGDTAKMFSCIVYIMELSKSISDIAERYVLTNTYNSANAVLQTATRIRTELVEATGSSEDELFSEIASRDEKVQAAKREAEEAAQRAAEAAEAARKAAEEAESERQRKAAEEAAAEAERQRKAAEEAARQAARAMQEALQAAVAVAKTEGAGTLGRQIADYAETFVGVLPYVWGGASLSTGADCSGFCSQILVAFGLLDAAKANVHGYDSYDFRTLGYAVTEEEMLPGDIICYPGHVAVYFGNGLVVHEPSVNNPLCAYGNAHMLEILTIRRFY